MLRIGFDIGGTKTELVALDEQGRERLRRRSATPHGRYEDALGELTAMVRDAERALGATADVGIGLPGLVAPQTGLVCNSFATPYNGQPLKRDLERLLGREVRIENDANCFALSEACDGAGRGAHCVFGIVLGTGAGGGIVVGGRLLPGANASAGEWGHNPLPWMTAEEFPGPRCTCGRLGCIEQFVSGTALAADHARATGAALPAAEIAAAAAQGDAGLRGVGRAPGAPSRARARPGHQPARSGRDRRGRRPVGARSPVCERAAPVARLCLRRRTAHAPRPRDARRGERRTGRRDALA